MKGLTLGALQKFAMRFSTQVSAAVCVTAGMGTDKETRAYAQSFLLHSGFCPLLESVSGFLQVNVCWGSEERCKPHTALSLRLLEPEDLANDCFLIEFSKKKKKNQ